MNRRRFVSTFAGALGATVLGDPGAEAQKQQDRPGAIKAVAFDGFVIFDPRSVEQRVEAQLPGKGAEFTNLWRMRQFEYCWLRTSGGRYADFWHVTEDALRYAAKSLKISLNGVQHDGLMEAYLKMTPWPDVGDGLAELRRRGIRLAFLSNLTAAMLDANLKAAGLSEFFEPHLTTDRVQAYKPSPRAYQMGPDVFRLEKREIAFAAFGGWDAAGAKWFGYPTVWVNRGGVPSDELDSQPDFVAKHFNELVEFVARA